MDSLFNVSAFFELMTPILLFLLVLSAFLFLMYLKMKMDMFFEHVRSAAKDIRRIADALETDRRY